MALPFFIRMSSRNSWFCHSSPTEDEGQVSNRHFDRRIFGKKRSTSSRWFWPDYVDLMLQSSTESCNLRRHFRRILRVQFLMNTKVWVLVVLFILIILIIALIIDLVPHPYPESFILVFVLIFIPYSIYKRRRYSKGEILFQLAQNSGRRIRMLSLSICPQQRTSNEVGACFIPLVTGRLVSPGEAWPLLSLPI